MNHVLFLALKFLLERKRQTVISFLGVSIGVSAFVVMSSLMLGFQSYFIQQVIDLEPHIRIKPKERAKDRLRQDFSVVLGAKPKEEEKILGWRDLMQNLDRHPEVVGSAPRLVSRGIVQYGTKEKPVNLLGIDPAREPKASIIERFLVYKNLQGLENRRDGVILGVLVRLFYKSLIGTVPPASKGTNLLLTLSHTPSTNTGFRGERSLGKTFPRIGKRRVTFRTCQAT
jgi:lipoprotein-releasing system permease protein